MNDFDIALSVEEFSEKFAPKKKNSELLSESYSRLGFENKAVRVAQCGTFLEFRQSIGSDSDGWHLREANFCRDRLCPMCSWRRSYKIFGQVSKIMNSVGDDYAYLFLTLTVPNCQPSELNATVDRLFEGFHNLCKDKRFKKVACGFFRALEITRHNKYDRLNGTYHPHFHCIIPTRKSYFKSKDYLSHSEWLEMWRSAYGDNSINQVDIRRCKAKEEIQEGEEAVKALSSAVAEIAKYSVKDVDYIFPENEALTDKVVSELGVALKGRRLCSYGGIFKETHKKLGLDDYEKGDLIHLDDEKIRSDLGYMIRRYSWSCGCYKLIEQESHFDIVNDDDED